MSPPEQEADLRTDAPVVLVVSTHAWTQVSRLAFRFWKYGCRISALCAPDSELRLAMHVDICYSYRAWDVLGSLRAAIEQSRAEYVVPGDDLAYVLMHKLAAQYPAYQGLVERSVGSTQSFDILRSRYRTLAEAERLGIRIARTHPLSWREDWERSTPGVKFPLLAKVDGSSGGRGVAFARDAEELRRECARLMPRPGKLRGLLALDPMARVGQFGMEGAGLCAQERIEGVPATAMFACWQGRVLGSLQARVLASQGETRPAMVIELMRDERMERAGELLAAGLRLSGFFGLDFMLSDATGEPYLIEVNPRCTQMGHIQVAGRTDLAGLLWAQWTGRPEPEPGDEQLGKVVAFHPFVAERFPQNELLRKSRSDIAGDDLLVGNRVLRRQGALVGWLRRKVGWAAFKHVARVRRSPSVHYFKNSVWHD